MTNITNAPLKNTPLYEEHLKLNAKIVDFGGWNMPIHYTSQIEEHHAVRKNVGMFDVSHMLIIDLYGEGNILNGDGALKGYLKYLLANNIEKLKNNGKALYSCMLNTHGGVIDDLIVYYINDNHYRLVVNAGCAAKDLTWLMLRKQDYEKDHAQTNISLSVKIRRDLAIIAVQGPNSLELFDQNIQCLMPFHVHTNLQEDIMIARTGYTGEDGVEIMLPVTKCVEQWQKLLASGVAPCGLGARDTLRLEAGMNLYGQDMDVDVLPHDAGLSWTISFSEERDFIGKEALLANVQKHQFLGLILESGGILRSHQNVFNKNDIHIGEITSGGYSPTLQKSIAMAKLDLTSAKGDTVYVDIRGKKLAAQVVSLPFYKKQ
jgi:aminomethyltransferase